MKWDLQELKLVLREQLSKQGHDKFENAGLKIIVTRLAKDIE